MSDLRQPRARLRPAGHCGRACRVGADCLFPAGRHQRAAGVEYVGIAGYQPGYCQDLVKNVVLQTIKRAGSNREQAFASLQPDARELSMLCSEDRTA